VGLEGDFLKLQYEYAGSTISFEDLEFNLFVAGELEIISGNKISDIMCAYNFLMPFHSYNS
jgi:hypothetical protein